MENKRNVTFCVSTEADKRLSYFHQQIVGIFTSSYRHLFGAYDHLKERTRPPVKWEVPALCVLVFICTYLCLYLWQESGDKVFVFCAEPFHDVDQTLQSRLRESNRQQRDRITQRRKSERMLPSTLGFYEVYSPLHGRLTLFAGDDAFFRVSSRTTLSVSRFSTTNDRHASISPPHISSSTRYAFFCMAASLVWEQQTYCKHDILSKHI